MKSNDRYVYPGTDILINRFGCRNADTLYKIEAESTAGNLAYLQFHPIDGSFDFQHLKDIHRFIFKDIYDWAGEIRDVDIGKNNLFCRVPFIEEYSKTVFKDFYSSCYEQKTNKETFLEAFSSHYADMNALHPFRDGNGRAQREFARELCLKCGFVFDLTTTTHKEMLDASIKSFNSGDTSGFISIFRKSIIPLDEYNNYLSKISSALLILSKDDI